MPIISILCWRWNASWCQVWFRYCRMRHVRARCQRKERRSEGKALGRCRIKCRLHSCMLTLTSPFTPISISGLAPQTPPMRFSARYAHATSAPDSTHEYGSCAEMDARYDANLDALGDSHWRASHQLALEVTSPHAFTAIALQTLQQPSEAQQRAQLQRPRQGPFIAGCSSAHGGSASGPLLEKTSTPRRRNADALDCSSHSVGDFLGAVKQPYPATLHQQLARQAPRLLPSEIRVGSLRRLVCKLASGPGPCAD